MNSVLDLIAGFANNYDFLFKWTEVNALLSTLEVSSEIRSGDKFLSVEKFNFNTDHLHILRNITGINTYVSIPIELQGEIFNNIRGSIIANEYDDLIYHLRKLFKVLLFVYTFVPAKDILNKILSYKSKKGRKKFSNLQMIKRNFLKFLESYDVSGYFQYVKFNVSTHFFEKYLQSEIQIDVEELKIELINNIIYIATGNLKYIFKCNLYDSIIVF